MISIYTDGSCRDNGKKGAIGAWGYIIIDNDIIVRCAAESVEDTTNQIMELTAALQCCKAAEELYSSFTDICIYSDSAYLINCINDKWYEKWEHNGWTTSKKQAVINPDLWKELIPFFEKANFHFKKVKGHANNRWNNEIDQMVQRISASKGV